MPYHGHEPESKGSLLSTFEFSMVPAHCELAILPLPVGAVMELVEEGVESFIGHWGKSDNPYAEAYGWVKIMKEEALAKWKKG